MVNSLAPGKSVWNFRHVIFKHILVINGWDISCEIALIWMSLDFTDDQSTLLQMMAWCHQATSHYLSQCWPRSLSPYGVTWPQWVGSLVQVMACQQLGADSLSESMMIFTHRELSNMAINTVSLVYDVAIICHQVRCICWGHPSLFHTAMSLLSWYQLFCTGDISYRFIWMKFINMLSMCVQSGMHRHFHWWMIVVLTQNPSVLMCVDITNDPKL